MTKLEDLMPFFAAAAAAAARFSESNQKKEESERANERVSKWESERVTDEPHLLPRATERRATDRERATLGHGPMDALLVFVRDTAYARAAPSLPPSVRPCPSRLSSSFLPSSLCFFLLPRSLALARSLACPDRTRFLTPSSE